MLKGIFLCFFLVSSFFLFAQPGMDVLHYKFEIELSDHSDTIKGKAEIKILLTQWNKSISFDLVNLNNKGKGMTVTKVSFLRPASSVSFQQQNDKLIITPSIAFNPDDTAVIVINYKGIPADGLIISKNKYGDRTFFADNWPNRAHNWIPCKDEPGDKSNFEFLVTAPSKYDVISNGKKIEERSINTYKKLTHWSSDIPLPTKVMVIGVARFAVKEYPDSPPDIPVSAWVYPQDSITGFRNYSVAPSILKFMSAYIAPYPYNKLANVESTTIFGGMENAGAIFYFEGSASSNNTQESLIAHEIAHQWFGDMASEKKFSHLWLSEGFATYLTHIYIESKYGTDSLNNQMKADRRQVISFSRSNTRPVVDSISPYINLLNANSYQKGGWVLHMLRRQLGDTVFQQIIRRYYDKFKGKNADTRDFETVAEEVSGKNLKTFFDQWLYSSSLPQLEISWQYSDTQKSINLTVEQKQSLDFQFPLEVQIKSSAGNSTTHSLLITFEKQSFTLPVSGIPSSVIIDPHTSTLGEWIVKENK